MEYGEHGAENVWGVTSFRPTVVTQAMKDEVIEQRKAIVSSIAESTAQRKEEILQEMDYYGFLERQEDRMERLDRVRSSLEQQDLFMQQHEWGFESEQYKKNMSALTGIAGVFGGASEAVSNTGKGIIEGLGGLGEGLGNIGGGLTGGLQGVFGGISTGLAGIGVFAVILVVLVIVFLVMGRGF